VSPVNNPHFQDEVRLLVVWRGDYALASQKISSFARRTRGAFAEAARALCNTTRRHGWPQITRPRRRRLRGTIGPTARDGGGHRRSLNGHQ
jgi:hypothetical protein